MRQYHKTDVFLQEDIVIPIRKQMTSDVGQYANTQVSNKETFSLVLNLLKKEIY